MGIPNLRKFIADFREILLLIGILNKTIIQAEVNILDYSGQMYAMVQSLISKRVNIQCQDVFMMIKSYINRFTYDVNKQYKIVFDPFNMDGVEQELKDLKKDEHAKRNEKVFLTRGLEPKDIFCLFQQCYYLLKEEFKDQTNIQFIVSRVESDMMCGSLCKTIENSQIYSTDSDLLIYSYPKKFVYLNRETYQIDTKRLFDIFGLDAKGVAQLPIYAGCDYQQTLRAIVNPIFTKQQFQLNFDDPKIALMFKVFSQPQSIEIDYNIDYKQTPEQTYEIMTQTLQKQTGGLTKKDNSQQEILEEPQQEIMLPDMDEL